MSFSSMTKSFIASKHISNLNVKQQDISAKSYVQDGLVALFDGIENVDWGVHDNNATIWMNLANGQTANMIGTIPNDYEWTEIACVRKQLNRGRIEVDLTSTMLESCRNAKFSVEIVTSTPLFQSDWAIQALNICENPSSDAFNKGILGVTRGDNAISNSQLMYTCKYYHSWMSVVLSQRDMLASIAIVFDENQMHGYLDGTLFKSAPCTPISSIDAVVLRSGSSSYAFRGHYHCIRIYNRTLSEKEIKHNSEIDKVRFEL